MVPRERNSRYHLSQKIRENGEMAPEQDRRAGGGQATIGQILVIHLGNV